MRLRTFCYMFGLSALTGCSVLKPDRPTPDADYQTAVKVTCHPETGRVCNTLTAITPANTRLRRMQRGDTTWVLMLSWKERAGWYYRPDTWPLHNTRPVPYNTGSRDLWVTAVPDVQERLRHYKGKNLKRRMTELLGLPPATINDTFLTFWVRPEDLYRPCPDPDVTDCTCGLVFPANADLSHVQWIEQTRRYNHYNADTTRRYPWTELGYTYDWNRRNRTHIGVSEFVVRRNATVYVDSVFSTAQYLRGAKNK